jgi:hypothetical protein
LHEYQLNLYKLNTINSSVHFKKIIFAKNEVQLQFELALLLRKDALIFGKRKTTNCLKFICLDRQTLHSRSNIPKLMHEKKFYVNIMALF